MSYLILTENDISEWDDKTGIQYHYPPKYKNLIKTGCKFIYYKGEDRENRFIGKRLTNKPHYFGAGEIGEIVENKNSNSYYAEIKNFTEFLNPVIFKQDNLYFEPNANLFYTNNKQGNYFRGNAVRLIDEITYYNIISNVIEFNNPKLINTNKDLTTVETDGKRYLIYTTKYERKKSNRDAAIKIHGTTCHCCKFNFEKIYGEIGKNFIHIHHIKPLHSLEEEIEINPETDLIPVCPNCHSMIHRRKDRILTIEELKLIMGRI